MPPVPLLQTSKKNLQVAGLELVRGILSEFEGAPDVL